MNLIPTRFEGLMVLEPKLFGDARGYFMESYNERVFSDKNLYFDFVQDNQSLSREAGVIRGLHYQLNPKAQTKVVRVLRGAIYDVVVDIRKGSSTFGEWQGFILSEENRRQLLVPKGFAHGFCTITAETIVAYKVDEYYSPEHDRGIIWNDPNLKIDWPTSQPILSDKDKNHPLLKGAEINFE
ncbi:dTDP-4-dehydrorhamnose 3,5-epimerase [Aneurinibacillus tyrosinisolvens]|uniref:dTDP-4-dehydrorhamnose 3,5-epimerase n=1 Tax=Aneurinibacillus tyrosinisolvens TaxID=1443435 RepID=UPI00063EDFC8|nr:dTDP-4-dehydrorhamnose 3,5-epimerase [Aneurinibacillus tyrosinisolvens]